MKIFCWWASGIGIGALVGSIAVIAQGEPSLAALVMNIIAIVAFVPICFWSVVNGNWKMFKD